MADTRKYSDIFDIIDNIDIFAKCHKCRKYQKCHYYFTAQPGKHYLRFYKGSEFVFPGSENGYCDDAQR